MSTSDTNENHFCLRWKHYQTNLQCMFAQLLKRRAFCDVTLASEGQTIKAHKIVLSACSSYFDAILHEYEAKDPIIILKDVKFSDIKLLLDYMYKGEINVKQECLDRILKLADDLKIKGLAEMTVDNPELSTEENGLLNINSNDTFTTDNSFKPNDSKEAPKHNLSHNDFRHNRKKRKRSMSPSYNSYEYFDAVDENKFDTKSEIQSNYDEIIHINESKSHEMNRNYDNNENIDEFQDESGNFYNENDNCELYIDSENFLSVPKIMSLQKSNYFSQLEAQFSDVIKMNDYLNSGRRQQFWEEPFTKRVMDAIKNKSLELKTAAEILGVSYGTLYGRYRDTYRCLKHSTRPKDIWGDQDPIELIRKLKRKEITLAKAAEERNLVPKTLLHYLKALNPDDNFDSLSNEDSVSDNGVSSIVEESNKIKDVYPIF